MRILFLMIAYPDVSFNSSMYTDLTLEFASNGHEVTVVVANGPAKTSLTIEGGINVLRVKTWKFFNTSFIKKGIASLLLPYQINRALKKFLTNIKPDVIILPTPPVTYLKTVTKLKKKLNVRIYLILRDIFPQNAMDLGILKNPLLFRLFRIQEKKLYSVSDNIGCMSTGNIRYIEHHNPEVDRNKLHLLPNWKTVNDYTEPDWNLKKSYGFGNKFIVLYGGNFGKPQQVETIIDLAREHVSYKDVIFLFVGEGSEKQKIVDLVTLNNLQNVVIKDQMTRDQYQELVKICDIGLINLSEKFTIPNIPSRALSYWEAKIPLLASVDKNTDFPDIIESSGSGLWSITGDLNTYKKNFDKLYFNKELRSEMGEKGYQYLIENCTTAKVYSTISEKLMSSEKSKCRRS
jgi:glycosyltransferase involved in cell wall biosynthesis